MKTFNILFFFFCIVFLGCSKKTPDKNTPSFKDVVKTSNDPILQHDLKREETNKDKWSYQINIHPDVPTYTLKFKGEDRANFMKVSKIVVFSKGDPSPIQVLDSIETYTPILNGSLVFEVEDVNFDGYKDIRIVKREALSSLPFIYYLFNKEKGIFERNIDFEVIESPQVDKTYKLIVSFKKENRNSFTTDYFKIINNKPVLIRQEIKQFKSSEYWETTIKQLVDGELKVIKHTVNE